MTGDPHDLAAAYALDALDPDERVEFEAHLGSCQRCRDAVDEFRETADRLAEADAVVPPSALRGRVLDEIGRTAQDDPIDTLAQRRSRRHRRALFATAAAVIALVIGGALLAGLRDRSPSVDDVVAAADAVETPLALTPDGETGTFLVVWSADEGRVAVLADDLRDPGEGRVYELWAIVDGTPTPAGLFDIEGGGVRSVVNVAALGEIEPAAWGVTIEPAAGSETPTTPILFYAET